MRLSTWERRNKVILNVELRQLAPDQWKCEIRGPLDSLPGRPAVFFSGGFRGSYTGNGKRPNAAFREALNKMSGTPVRIVDNKNGEKSGRFPDQLTP